MSNIYDFEEELVPRHRKKSNKKVKKSNHKHVYEPNPQIQHLLQ